MPFKIETIHVFIATDPNGEEGVTGKIFGDIFMPLVAADPARVDSLRAHAKEIAQMTGQTITLAKFEIRTDIEVINP